MAIKALPNTPSRFNPLTRTAFELNDDAKFWRRRLNEQYAYITHYAETSHSRPDAGDVLQSAMSIMERVRENLNRLL
jgi:hypothetical protein